MDTLRVSFSVVLYSVLIHTMYMVQTRKILIIGNGQLGSALAELYGDGAQQVTRAQLDLAKAGAADYDRLLRDLRPDIVINSAAYTAVDKAEEQRDLAMQVNAHAVGLLADSCRDHQALLVQYSTDYVFDGSGDTSWQETDQTAPVNYYGASKLAGEQRIQQSGAAHLIFRISWVYDAHHANFLNTMLRLAAERDTLSIINDQIGAPCYAADLATGTKAVLDQLGESLAEVPSGVYHMCSQGLTSWHGFASEIFAQARQRGQALAIQNLKAIPTTDYPTPAARPLNSRLDCSKLKNTFNVELPSWQDGLARCMEEKYAG